MGTNQGNHVHPAIRWGLLAVLFLCGSTSIGFADDHMLFHAPVFSDPNVLAPVPDDWQARPVEYLERHSGSDLVVALGQQSYPLFHELIQEYAKKQNLKISVEQGTCGITSGRLLKKNVDVGAFCCPPGKNDRYPGMEFHSLGISPIALVVNPENPVTDITSEQAKKLFNGQITRWSELNSAATQNVQPVGRLHCKKRPGHWRSLLSSGDEFSPRLFEVGVITDMISQVLHSVGSVGWETPLMVEENKDQGKVKMLFVDGKSPLDIDNVAEGRYPLYRSYTLTSWSLDNKKSQEAKKLIQFLQQHIEKVYKDIGFVPVSKLRAAGWKFNGEELIGEPDHMTHMRQL